MSVFRLILFLIVVVSVSSYADLTAECGLGYEAMTTAQMSYRIETPENLKLPVQAAKQATDLALESQEIAATPEAYRKRFQEEFRYVRAQLETRREIDEMLAKGLLDASNPSEVRKQTEQVMHRHLSQLPEETVLIIDTPLTSQAGKSLNDRDGVVFVVDHHGAYAPQSGLDNSGAQIIQRLMKSAQKFPDNTEKALQDFRRELYGPKNDKVILTADNLADAAEVMAVLRNPELQRRIVENPELGEMLMESGRFTDFFVFSGDGYEKNNRSAKSQTAIAISKAIMQSHSEILKKANILFGDRIASLSAADQKKLLEEATTAAETLLLEATAPGPFPSAPLVVKKSKEFDAHRGGPDKLVLNGTPTSFADAVAKHDQFLSELPNDLKSKLPENQVVLAEKALNRYAFGHRPISTGNQFTDWAASPMANAYHPEGRRPITFEVAGENADAVGKPAIIAKSGQRAVDLRPIAEALNHAARAKYRQKLVTQYAGEELDRRVNAYSEFTARGTDLVFSFGGHSLTRAEITAIVASALLEKGNEIVPATP